MLAVDSMPAISSISMSVWLPYGSRNEKPRYRGFFHYIEHMLFKGTPDQDARQLARVFESTGGFVNAFTEKSTTCVHCTVPADNWRNACETLLKMAFSSTFPVEEFEKEKKVILSEILQTEDDPEDMAHERFFQSFWPGQSVGMPIAGSLDDVENISRDALYDFYLTVFKPEFACISVAGNIAEEELFSYIDSMLNKIVAVRRHDSVRDSQSDDENFMVASIPAVANIFTLYEKSSSSLAYVIHGIETPPPSDNRDYMVGALVNEILGGSTISRLFQKLREEEGLCYTVFSSYEPETTEGLWIIHLQTSKKHLLNALDMLEREEKRFIHEPPKPEEYRDTLSRISGMIKLAVDDSEYRQRRMARQYFSHGKIVSVEEELACLYTIGYDEIVSASIALGSTKRARFVFGAIPQAKLATRGYIER